MAWLLTSIFLGMVCLTSSTLINGGKFIYCTRATLHEVRIKGCSEEPCYLKKGTRLPLEVDFTFFDPKKTQEVNFSVFVPFWNIPDKLVIGSNLVDETTCHALRLPCPTVYKTHYTLRTYLYADPQLKTTIGEPEAKGEVISNWLLNPVGPTGYSQCYFSVKLILV